MDCWSLVLVDSMKAEEKMVMYFPTSWRPLRYNNDFVRLGDQAFESRCTFLHDALALQAGNVSFQYVDNPVRAPSVDATHSCHTLLGGLRSTALRGALATAFWHSEMDRSPPQCLRYV